MKFKPIMLSITKGFPLLLRFGGIMKSKKCNSEEIVMNYGKTKFKTFKYTPNTKSKKNKFPAILLIHGMSNRGISDPRIIELAENLSSAGYIVYTPELEEVKNLLITADTIKNIKSTIHAMNLRSDEYLPNQTGLFSVSFSGGMAMLALSDREIGKLIQSVLLIGPYSDFVKTLPYVMTNPEADNYGILLVFYNYIQTIHKNPGPIKKILLEAALDNGLIRTGDKAVAPKLLSKLSKNDREMFEKILTDKDYRMRLVEKMAKKTGKDAKELSPYYCLETMDVPLILIHGKGDNVVPPSESVATAEKLKSLDKEHYLQLTSLVSHGDKGSIFSQIGEIPGMLYAFGKFFGYLNK